MDISLSTKERMLLEDQKNHEEICIQKYSNYAQMATDPQLKQIFNNHAQKEQEHLNTVNQMLQGKIPNVNSQQSGQQGGGQQNQQSGQQMGGMQSSQSNFINQNASFNSDKDLCTDILMTEKYVSNTYDTAIFEFKNSQARDVLNHIQKEEQKHGEAVFQYMNNKGMY